MKRQLFISMALLTTIILLLPVQVFAEEEADLSGGVSVITRTVDGERESSKFEEYREIPDGISGNAYLKHRGDRFFFDLKAKDIAEDDQYIRVRSGLYGKFKVELIYDKIPHRFAYDARTLYSGIGSGQLVLGDQLQSDLQAAATLTDKTTALLSFFQGAQATDLELFRKTGRINVDVTALDPVNFRIEFRREERDGTRPFSGSFGFGNMEEIPEPIDYDTTDIKLIAEYAKRPFYLSASYMVSIFENNTDTLSWDHPFRVTDSTSPLAYVTPLFGQTDGPKTGRIDLAPDNEYQNVTLTGAATELPLKSRLTATASWGWMKQDDGLVPYTTNTSITNVSLAPFCTSQNASDSACLPISEADVKVKTSLYNLVLTSKPASFIRTKAKFRYYERDNDTAQVAFPGWVRVDAVWEELSPTVPILTEPVSYDRLTTGIDVTFDVVKSTSLTVGYTYDSWDRTHREAHDSDESIYSVSVNSTPVQWLDLRASYKRAEKDVDYDFAAPFEQNILAAGGVIDGDSVPQLPFLRKYDEADRDRDNAQLIAMVYPTDKVTLAGSIIYERNDYDESSFGLLNDKRQVYSLEADYEVSERVSLNAYFSHERYENSQKVRQWTPGGTGDPFVTDTMPESTSNWNAENEDKTNTIGAGIKFVAIPERLDLKVDYLYSETDGDINLANPGGGLGPAPIPFENVDDIRRQLVNLKVKYRYAKNLSFSIGYTWEKFEVKDFDNTGFAYIPLDPLGDFNGAILMGAIPSNYEVNIVYAKVGYTF